MKIQSLIVFILSISVAGSLYAGSVSPQQNNKSLQDSKGDDGDSDDTEESDEDIIIMDDEDSNDDQGVDWPL